MIQMMVASVVSSLPILVTLMLEAIHSSSVVTGATWHHIPEERRSSEFSSPLL
jgi:hypothetical protein